MTTNRLVVHATLTVRLSKWLRYLEEIERKFYEKHFFDISNFV